MMPGTAADRGVTDRTDPVHPLVTPPAMASNPNNGGKRDNPDDSGMENSKSENNGNIGSGRFSAIDSLNSVQAI